MNNSTKCIYLDKFNFYAGKVIKVVIVAAILTIGFKCFPCDAADLPHENGTWKSLPGMPTNRHDIEAVAYEGKFYVIAGADDYTLDVVEIYNPATNTWTKGAPIPETRGWFGSGLIGGKVYCFGGKSVRTKEEKEASGSNETYKFRWSLNIYDIASDKWTTGSHMYVPRAGVHGAAIGGKAIAPGGWISTGAESFTFGVVEFYDPKTDKWSFGEPLPEERYASAVAVIDNKLYLSGGSYRGPKNVFQGERSDLFIYDLKTGKWTTGAPMPTPRRDHSAAVIGKRIYFIGGVTLDGKYVNAVEIYDTGTNTWSTATPLPTAKGWMGAGVIDGKIYVAGGANSTPGINGFKWLNEFHVYEPPQK